MVMLVHRLSHRPVRRAPIRRLAFSTDGQTGLTVALERACASSRPGSLTLEPPKPAAHAEEMFRGPQRPGDLRVRERASAVSRVVLRARFAKARIKRSANGREQWLNWVIRLPTSELIGFTSQATVHPDGPRGHRLRAVQRSLGPRPRAPKAGPRPMISELVRATYRVRKPLLRASNAGIFARCACSSAWVSRRQSARAARESSELKPGELAGAARKIERHMRKTRLDLRIPTPIDCPERIRSILTPAISDGSDRGTILW